MRIGIISDIHCNIDALNAVLAEFEHRQVDKYIFLGDVIGLGLHPEECVQLLIAKRDRFISSVRGNHENYLLYGLPKFSHSDPSRGLVQPDTINFFRWNHSLLSEKSKQYLNALPSEQTIDIEGVKIFVTHYPLLKERTFRTYYRRPNLTECQEIFAGFDADVYLYGHTHRSNEAHDGNKHYINPGSAGCPIETNSASVGILDISDGQVNYERIDVAYDIDKNIRALANILPQFPFAAEIIHDFYRNDSEYLA